MADNTSYPADRNGVVLPLKISVGITSVLSILGGFLIVLTFCLRLCLKSSDGPNAQHSRPARSKMAMMSPGRIILVNLSIADIILAGSHLWGVSANYQNYFLKNDNAHSSGPNGSTDTMCDVQGAIAVYGTIASFLWTIILSFFVVGTLLLPHPRWYGSLYALLVYIVTCWGLPAVVVIVVSIMKELGVQDDATIAWCYILPKSRTQDVFINVFAYNLWSYLSIILLLIFFIVTLCYTFSVPSPPANQPAMTENMPLVNQSRNIPQQEMKSDYIKLIFAALILVVLRIWDAIYVSLAYHPHYDRDIAESQWIVVLIFLAGIGNSAQGAANAVLFLLCTKTYRTWMMDSFLSCCKRTRNNELPQS